MTILKAIDVSSHQPRDLTALIQTHQPDHVIVKGYLPIENISQDHTRAQVRSARQNGCTVGMYVWCYRSSSPIETIDSIISLCASMDLSLPLLWLDCETYTGANGAVIDPGPDSDWLARAVDHAERVYQMKCGIYTGRWWVRDYFPGGESAFAGFNRLPLWLSLYDAMPDINIWIPFSGFTHLAAKQWTSSPIDINVIRSEYTVYAADEPEPIDPCLALRSAIQAIHDARPYKAPPKKRMKELLTL